MTTYRIQPKQSNKRSKDAAKGKELMKDGVLRQRALTVGKNRKPYQKQTGKWICMLKGQMADRTKSKQEKA